MSQVDPVLEGMDELTERQALSVAHQELKRGFLAAGLELVDSMPAGEISERHESAIARVRLTAAAAKVIVRMIAERPEP